MRAPLRLHPEGGALGRGNPPCARGSPLVWEAQDPGPARADIGPATLVRGSPFHPSEEQKRSLKYARPG